MSDEKNKRLTKEEFDKQLAEQVASVRRMLDDYEKSKKEKEENKGR